MGSSGRENGNNLESVIGIPRQSKRRNRKKSLLLFFLHTEMGAGVDYMMGSHAWHGKTPNDEQLAKALDQLQLDEVADY